MWDTTVWGPTAAAHGCDARGLSAVASTTARCNRLFLLGKESCHESLLVLTAFSWKPLASKMLTHIPVVQNVSGGNPARGGWPEEGAFLVCSRWSLGCRVGWRCAQVSGLVVSLCISSMLLLRLPLRHLGLITVQCNIHLYGVCTSVSGPFAI